MIRFKTIRYKNFLSTGNAFIEFDLDSKDRTLIIGENGSGKSTFLDALTFSLFGKPFRKINKGNIVNTVNNKDCVTEIEFDANNKSYKIVRGVKPNVFEIWQDGVFINQDSASKDYQEYLETFILRTNYKTFTQVVILGSAKFTPFMQLSAGDRRGIIEDLLDIQVFSVMTDIVKKKISDNKEAVEKNKLLLSSKEDARNFIERNIKSLKQNNEKRLDDLRLQYSTLQAQGKSIIDEISKLEKENDTEAFDDMSKYRTKHSEAISIRSKLENKKDHLMSEVKFYCDNENCPTCEQEISPDLKETKKKESEAKIKELDDAIEKVSLKITAYQERIKEAEEQSKAIVKISNEISAKKQELRSIKLRMSDIKDEANKIKNSDDLLNENEAKFEEVVGHIENLTEEKKGLLDDKQYFDTALNLLKDGGIKTMIIRQYLPIINKLINTYLSQMGFFVSFNIDETFEETIKSRHRDTFAYNNFSEGEKFRIDLAILLTWRAVARIKNSCSTNLLVMDEVCDSSMDTEGVESFLRTLEHMGNDTTVFVISHREHMQDKFKKVIQFKKLKNFSVMI